MSGALTRMLGRNTAATGDAAILALGLTAWYDPSDFSTMFQDTAGTTPATLNGVVRRINDKSGNGFHLTNSTNQPNLRRDGSGKYYLEFSNVGTWLDNTSLAMTQPNDFVVGAYFDSVANRVLFDGITTRQELVGASTGTGIAVYAGTAVRTAGTIAGGTPYVFTARFDGASSLIRTNGASTTVSATPGSNGITGLRVGTFSGSTGALPGRIYGLLCRDTVFGAGELTTVEAYMAGKTGVTL